jgi:3-methyladenine DNA glycosylase Mpg
MDEYMQPASHAYPFEVPAMADAYYGVPNKGAHTYTTYLNTRQRMLYKTKRFLHWWLFEGGKLDLS